MQSGTTLTKIVCKEHGKQICFSYNFRKCLEQKPTSKRKSNKYKKNAAKSSSGKNTDFEKFVAHQLNEVLYHFTSIWIEEKLMKKYINHGRSKMQGMYLKFPIFLITFDIIKEKELHQSTARFKTAKGRVKKMERMMWNIIKAFNIVILKNLSRKPKMKIWGWGCIVY